MSDLKPLWEKLQRDRIAGVWESPTKAALIYALTGIIKEFDQKLNGGYLSTDYIAEKLETIQYHLNSLQERGIRV